MTDILIKMEKATEMINNATNFKEEFEAWKEWVKQFDAKTALEESNRKTSKKFEL